MGDGAGWAGWAGWASWAGVVPAQAGPVGQATGRMRGLPGPSGATRDA